MACLAVTAETFDACVLACIERAAVLFSASWCGECQLMAPVWENAAAICNGVRFFKADCSQTQSLAQRCGVMSIPCVLLFENGSEIKRSIGCLTPSEIEAFVTQ